MGQKIVNDLAIPVLLVIDVEPDERLVSYQARRWKGYENLHEFLFKMRPVLESATGRPVHYNWMLRLDPQIEHAFGRADWVVKQYRSLLEEADAANDEIGIHVHSWRPCQHWWRKSWLADFSDATWINHCVNMAHHTFINSFARQPKCFSFGEGYMSDKVLTQLESLEYRCDLSMYPGRQALQTIAKEIKSSGWLPDYRATPRHPFKPSRKDFTRPIDNDERNLWEIPVSVQIVESGQNEDKGEQKLLFGMPFQRIPNIVEQNLVFSNPYLQAVMRTDVRMDPYNCAQFDKTIYYFIEHPRVKDMVFETCTDFVDLLDRG